MGKFARVALQTKELDYNGRLCMVSAGAGNKKAFGIDRAANYWEDILHAEVILCAGTNVAECSPITTDYIWRARDKGAKLIMVDPRVTPLARTCDLHLPVRPGADSALLLGMLRVLIEEDLIDHQFIAEHTSGWDETKAAALAMSLEDASEISGVEQEDILKAARMWGTAKPHSFFTREGSSTTRKESTTLSHASTWSLPPGESGARVVATARSLDKATDKAAASTGISVISFPATATSRIPSIGNTSPACGESGKKKCRSRAIRRLKSWR